MLDLTNEQHRIINNLQLRKQEELNALKKQYSEEMLKSKKLSEELQNLKKKYQEVDRERGRQEKEIQKLQNEVKHHKELADEVTKKFAGQRRENNQLKQELMKLMRRSGIEVEDDEEEKFQKIILALMTMTTILMHIFIVS